MSTPTSASSVPAAPVPQPKPKYIRQAYLSPDEAILRESRATLLYYLPGPIILLLIFLFLDYEWAVAAWGWPGSNAITNQLVNLKGVASGAPFHYVGLLFGFITLLCLLFLLVRYLIWMRTAYAVTTSRVIVQRGILSRDFDEIPVTMVRAMDVRQSVGQRILGYGTIKLTSEGENRIANEAWRGIPHPWEFQKLVNAAAERYNRPPGSR
jgi:membrane protein YdbS with pleckstrin-like domain